ncbi:hypothetical protein TNCV_4033171 [Trichonephila clavipes]|nr:hypothetical protein TNCV_4033171 [Trichonephila clavipes]
MKQKRVGRPRFERLPNVVPVASLTDETDLVSLIRTIVREEVHRLVNQTQESLDSDPQSLEEIVQDEVERVLAPVSTKPTETRPRPTYAAVTRKYRAPVKKFPPEPRKTDVWRTADNRPVCFHCGRPGHVMRYCRERKAVFDNSSKPPTELRRHPRRHIADPVSRQAVGARKTKESDLPRSHDVILGWDFLEASQAVIDCGQNELVLEDICRDSTAPDAWNLYATRDYTLKPHSLTRITVSGYQTRGDINVVLDGSKHLLFEKNIATPSMVSTYRNGKSDVWVTNLQFRNQIIPRGMCIGQAEPLNEGHLCVISDTSGCLDDKQETSESQMNCSLMMSPELSDEQRNKLSELLRKFSGLFTKTDKSTAAKTNVKHRIFTGDHAPINQRAYRVSPTERRIIHEEVQKMLDEGIVQPSESPWSSPIVLSLLKSGVEFHWGPEEVEAFNSLKKALTSDPVLGMYDERASTEIHTDASGYGIGAVLVQIQNNVEKVIAYASRTLTKAEKNYSTTERECLAIVWATNKFRPYIFGKHFTVVTDHHSLCWLMNLKDPSGRLARWALRLQEHDFDVKYKTGKKHSDADALSRNPVEEETETSDKFLAVTTSMNLAMEQKKDQDLAKLKLLRNSSKNEEFRFIDGILCRKNFDPDGKLWLPVIPKHLRADILRHFHDAPTAGHLGFAKTYDRIRKRFYWPGMYRNVVRYVMHCRECQRRKSVPQRPPGRLVPIPPAIAPFHRIGIDLLWEISKVCSWKQMDNSLHGLLNTICNNKSLADSRSRRNSEVLT